MNKKFNKNNTEGFTTEQLSKMNKLYYRLTVNTECSDHKENVADMVFNKYC